MAWRGRRDREASAPNLQPPRPSSSSGYYPTSTGPSGPAGRSAGHSRAGSSAATHTPTGTSLGEYLAPFHTAVSQTLSSAQSMAGSQYESSRLLADLAPHIMKPRILSAAANASTSVTSAVSSNALIGFLPVPLGFSMGSRDGSSRGRFSAITQPARNLVKISNALRNGPFTGNDLMALESSHQVLAEAALSISSGIAEQEERLALASLNGLDLATSSGATAAAAASVASTASADQVSLLRGFEATIPSARLGRERRRKERARDGPRLGLKHMGDQARGLLTDGTSSNLDADESIVSDAGGPSSSVTAPFSSREKRKERRASMRAKAAEAPLSEETLIRQDKDVKREKEDVEVRRKLLHTEMAAVDIKIEALQQVKNDLQRSLLSLKEEELELDDEQAGILEMIGIQRHKHSMPGTGRSGAGGQGGGGHSGGQGGGGQGGQHRRTGSERRTLEGAAAAAGTSFEHKAAQSSRRRRGPLFLPEEHDELPHNVAFMVSVERVSERVGGWARGCNVV